MPLDSFAFKDKLVVRKDSDKVTAFHGRDKFKVPTAESFFAALGAELIVLDIKKWVGNEVVIDLNKEYTGRKLQYFDLLIDNGTVEHCFNAPMTMWNIRNLVKPGGYIIHWNPHHMPNHGFYNFSGTFFEDWYNANGGVVEEMVLWNFQELDGKAVEQAYQVPRTARFNFPSYNNSLLTLVKIKGKPPKNPRWPTQTKYLKLGIQEK